MSSLISKLSTISSKEFVIIIPVENTVEELEFLSELDQLLSKYDREFEIREI